MREEILPAQILEPLPRIGIARQVPSDGDDHLGQARRRYQESPRGFVELLEDLIREVREGGLPVCAHGRLHGAFPASVFQHEREAAAQPPH
ncbi:MAG: hypothetical protein IPK20_25715 [Betaproteobacteria bacterium]|nr:hypothetical protein [Betaproteobacteria bacterium]